MSKVVPSGPEIDSGVQSEEPSTEAAYPDRSRRKHLWACLLVCLVGLVFYWRVTKNISGEMWPSDSEDGASFTWNIWYFGHQLFSGHNPFQAKNIFYPVGAPLAFHTYLPLVSLLLSPVVAIWGLPTAYVVSALSGMLLSGIGAYFLAHHFTRNRWAAFLAGAAYMMLPDRALRMQGHLNLLHTEVLPFVLLMAFVFYERPTRRNAVALGGLMAVSLLIESMFTAFLLIAIVVIAIAKWRTTFTRLVLFRWLQAAVVAIVVSLPILVPMLQQLFAHELDPLPGWGAAEVNSADLLSYTTPAQFHPLWGDVFRPIYSRITAGERFTYVTLTAIFLGVVGLIKWRHRHKRTIVAICVIFVVLSFGPFLHVANHQGTLFEYLDDRFSLPLPYLLLHFVPILNGVRIPARFSFMADLALLVLAAGALTWFLEHKVVRSRKWMAPVATVVLVGLIALECLPGDVPPIKTSAIPGPYKTIGKDRGNKAVIDVPMQWRDGFTRIGDKSANRDDTRPLYYQTAYDKPLANGMVARLPADRQQRLFDIPVYDQILALQGDRPGTATFTIRDLQALGIGYIVTHSDRNMPAVTDYVRSLALPVMDTDGVVTVWKVPDPR